MQHKTVAELRSLLAEEKKTYAAVSKAAEARVTRQVTSTGPFFSLRPLLAERSRVEKPVRGGATSEKSPRGTVLGLDDEDRVWTITTRDATGTVTERTVLSREGAATRLLRKLGTRFVVEVSEGDEESPREWWWCSSFGAGSGYAERSGGSLLLLEVTYDFESKQSSEHTDVVAVDAAERPVSIVRRKQGAPDRPLWGRAPEPGVDEGALARWLDDALATHRDAGALLLLEGERSALAYFVPRESLERAKAAGGAARDWLNPAEHDVEELDVPLPPGLSSQRRHAALVGLAKLARERMRAKKGPQPIVSLSDPEMATLERSLREIHGADADALLAAPPPAPRRAPRKRR